MEKTALDIENILIFAASISVKTPCRDYVTASLSAK
jgi:hypothetical protein